MSVKAKVTDKGAVLLGDNVACDAFDDKRPLRVVTHAHADHLGGLKSSLKKCAKVLLTPATRDLIGIVDSTININADCIETLEYNKPLSTGTKHNSA